MLVKFADLGKQQDKRDKDEKLRTTVAIPCLLGAFVVVSAVQMPAGTGITRVPFDKTRDGVSVSICTLTNKNGAAAWTTNYGGIIVSIQTPDRTGKLAHIVLDADEQLKFGIGYDHNWVLNRSGEELNGTEAGPAISKYDCCAVL